jgi:hypothetical protein
MRLIGALLVFGAAYLIGRDAGVVGYLESWALIAVCAMAGGFAGTLMSLDALARKTIADVGLDDESTDGEVEFFLKGHMSRWGWSGALAGGVIGALLATVVV